MKKRERQYRDAAMFTFLGYVGIIIVILGVFLGIGQYTGCNEEIQESIKNDHRPPNHLFNYMHPDYYTEQDTLTPQDSVSLYDSIESYERFIDVPAGADSIIMVAGILYKLNNDENKWTPLYPDEYVMWIGVNGDTIWE